jgi:hypothetical protein
VRTICRTRMGANMLSSIVGNLGKNSTASIE